MTQAAALIEQIVQGDKHAEKQLVETYYQGLLFILYRQCDSMSLAEDLTQDSFVVVLRKLREGDLRNPDALAAFIRQIGINTLIAYRRLQSRRQTDTSDLVDTFTDVQSNLLQHLHSRNASELVSQLLAELSTERDRDVLIRFYLLDEEKASICDSLSLTPAHFDRVLFRARQRLKALVDGNSQHASNVRHIVDGVIVLALILPLKEGEPVVSAELHKLITEVRETALVAHFNGHNGVVDRAASSKLL